MISIVLLTHNRSAQLRGVIQSLLVQTYKDFELLIFDDASSDDTPAVVASFTDPRIAYHRSEEKSSIPVLRNRGTDLARGEWIMVADDDDPSVPERLERLLAASQDADVVYSGWYVQDEDGMQEHKAFPFDLARLVYGRLLMHGTFLVRRSWLSQCRYDESRLYGTDYKLTLELARRGARFRFVDAPLIIRTLHTSNVTRLHAAHQTETARIAHRELLNSLTPDEHLALRRRWKELCDEDARKLPNALISIIVPHYDRPAFLAQQFAVLAKQTYKNFEVIVVDDGSTKDALSLVREAPFLAFHFFQQHDGYRLNTLRNYGRRLMRGKICMFLDCDIIPQGADFLARVARWHGERPRKFLIYHRTRIYPDRQEPDSVLPRSETNYYGFSGGMFSARSEDLREIGVFDPAYNGEWGYDDTDLAFRAVQRGYGICFDPSFSVHHLEHPRMDRARRRNKQYFMEKFSLA